jgi:hypothetical protein
MADISHFIRHYENCQSTFKETSFDSENRQYICMDESQKVVNFDKIIEEKYPNSNKRPKSFDTLFFHKNIIFCVEFKNQKKPNKQEIEKKLLDGKKELDSLLSNLNVSKKSYKFVFCLVYNKFVPKEERYKRGLYKSLRFEFLNEYKENGFVNDIYTEDVIFFTKEFKKQFQKELTC